MTESPTGPSRLRRTQRAPTSCIPCTKRKSRCSRTIPCAQCIARNRSQECKREVVLVKGLTIRDDDERLYDGGEAMTVEKLLEENKRLRMEVQLFQRIGLRKMPSLSKEKETNTMKDADEAAENDLERMATITNLLEMGRERNVGSAQGNHETPLPHARSPFELLKAALLPDPWLPNPTTALDMVQHAIDHLGWLYLSAHGPTTYEKCGMYLLQMQVAGSNCHGPAWLAFYLSLLALSVHHAPPDLREQWELIDPVGITKLWFDTAVQALLAADFMSIPDIYVCHAICNLACIFHVYGSPTLGSVLLASAVRIAQTLRIDQIADEECCEADRTGQEACQEHGILEAHLLADTDMKEREVRRRLWWFLLYRDWIAFPAGFRYVVAPELLLLQTPLNINDSTLISHTGTVILPPSTQFTDASFHVARARLSKIMHRFFGTYRQLDRGDPARHELAWETDRKLEQLLLESPFTTPTSSSMIFERSWHYPATHLFQSLIAHKRLLVFREFFALAFTEAHWQPARAQCVTRAEEIVFIRRAFTQPLHGASETTSHYLAAALVLALDFVFYGVNTLNTSQAHDRKDKIDELVSAIRTTETFEGNALRMVGQVQSLLGLAVSLRSDLNPPMTVQTLQDPTPDGSELVVGDGGQLELDEETAHWLDGLLYDIGSTEDRSSDTGYMATTDMRDFSML